jgi:hypothetical protein
VGLCLLLAAGCASTGRYSLPPLTGDPLVDGQNAITQGPPKDRVLWEYRTAVVALRRGLYEEAKQWLDPALARVEGSLGDDKSAQKSRRMFGSESSKTFIGEPYERVMAYFYRGIIYWRDGELDNARACFRSGQVHDSDAAEKTYASDYVLLDYLDGFATAKLGGDGSDAYQRALKVARGPAPPAYPTNANVLFFVDYGPGPTKFATGEYSEELRFRAERSRVRSAALKVDGKTASLPPYDDLYFQATTRGGRVMDHILGNKVVFKKTTGTIGDAALISGIVVAGGSRKNQEVGAGLIAAGLMAKIISSATTPEADIRSWDNLPLYLSFTALELPPGPHTAVVEFHDEFNRPLGNLTKNVTFNVRDGSRDTVLYISDQSTTPQSL